MIRKRFLLYPVVLAAVLAGCDSESQPNAPAADPAQQDPAELAKKTADMMKQANTGMDPSKIPGGATGPPGLPGTPKK
jgi:hypothetical protein